jgi:hypothetical protein
VRTREGPVLLHYRFIFSISSPTRPLLRLAFSLAASSPLPPPRLTLPADSNSWGQRVFFLFNTFFIRIYSLYRVEGFVMTILITRILMETSLKYSVIQKRKEKRKKEVFFFNLKKMQKEGKYKILNCV